MIKREIAIFLVVGSLTVAVDFFIYRGLIWLQILGVDSAKAGGFLVGTVFAYFANRFWTFGRRPHARGSAWRFVLLYGTTLAANVLVNAIVLNLLAGMAVSIHFAFLLATGVSAALNFIGMKLFVFRPSPQMHTI